MIWKIVDATAGLLCGVLSGWGVGGGSLLMVYMTAQGIPQQAAQGINLAYFLPVSAGSMISHIKNKLIEREAFLYTVTSGALSGLAAAYFANIFDTEILRRFFSIFIIIIGVKEIFHKKK